MIWIGSFLLAVGLALWYRGAREWLEEVGVLPPRSGW